MRKISFKGISDFGKVDPRLRTVMATRCIDFGDFTSIADGVVAAGTLVLKIIRAIYEKRERDKIKKQEIALELGNELFFGVLKNAQIFEGKSLDVVPSQVRDPEDCDGFMTIKNLLSANKEYNVKPIIVDKGEPPKPDINHCVVGGPVANPLTARICGYDMEDPKKKPSKPLKIYIERKAEVGPKRYFMDQKYDEGDWQVRFEDESLEIYEDRRGFIVNDYLIISVLPGWLSIDPSVYKSLVIYSVHGVATRALKMVLSNKERVLEEIKNRIKGAPYWQALVHVPSIDHDSKIRWDNKKIRQSEPEAIDLIDAVSLDLR